MVFGIERKKEDDLNGAKNFKFTSLHQVLEMNGANVYWAPTKCQKQELSYKGLFSLPHGLHCIVLMPGMEIPWASADEIETELLLRLSKKGPKAGGFLLWLYHSGVRLLLSFCFSLSHFPLLPPSIPFSWLASSVCLFCGWVWIATQTPFAQGPLSQAPTPDLVTVYSF